MTYGKCPALSQFVDELAGLELTARKGLSVPPAVIGPSGRNHCFRGRIIPARENKVSFLSLRQIRVSIEPPSKVFERLAIVGAFFGILWSSHLASSSSRLWCIDQSSLT